MQCAPASIASVARATMMPCETQQEFRRNDSPPNHARCRREVARQDPNDRIHIESTSGRRQRRLCRSGHTRGLGGSSLEKRAQGEKGICWFRFGAWHSWQQPWHLGACGRWQGTSGGDLATGQTRSSPVCSLSRQARSRDKRHAKTQLPRNNQSSVSALSADSLKKRDLDLLVWVLQPYRHHGREGALGGAHPPALTDESADVLPIRVRK